MSKATEASGHMLHAMNLEAMGRWVEARENYRLAAKLELECAEECAADAMRSFTSRLNAARAYYDAGDPVEAQRVLVRTVELARPCGVRIRDWLYPEVKSMREKFAVSTRVEKEKR